MQCLCLNASYEPLGFVPWQRAITLLYEGKVEVVESYPDRDLHSASTVIKMPSVIRFKRWVSKGRKQVRFSRESVYLRDGGKCQYCGVRVPRSEMTYDHVHPKSKGGKAEFNNVVLCCKNCNQHKGARSLEKSGMKLLRKPMKPESLPDITSINLTFRAGMPESWRTWLRDVSHWNEKFEESA